MRIHYPQRNRRNNIYKGKTAFLISLFLFCILFFSLVAGGMVRVATPLWLSQNFVSKGIYNFFGLIHSKQTLINENESLKSEIESLNLRLSFYDSVLNQNTALLDKFGRTEKKNFILTAVLTRPPKTLFDDLIVDVGTNSDVLDGDSVYEPEGALIGSVSEVYTKTSKIKLFSSSGEITSAILERGNTAIDLKGIGGGAFEANVSRTTEAFVGDKVLSSDISGSLMGVVEDVEMSPTDSYKKLLIRSAVNIFNIHLVKIYHE